MRARKTAWHATVAVVAISLGAVSFDAPAAPAPGTETPAAEDREGLPELGESSTLSDYLAYAALNNPGLEAAFLQWRAAIERVAQRRSLPDPRFTYRYFIEEVETRVGPQRHGLGIAQTFPWFGTLKARGDAAAEAANAARQRYEAKKLRLFHEVKSAYYELYYLGRSIEVLKGNRLLLEQIERLARVRYKVATGEHHGVIRAQVELGKLDNRLRSLEDFRGPIAARLNAALNRPADAPVPWPATVPPEGTTATDEEVLQWLREASPELKALAHEALAAEQSIRLAQKQFYPDVTLGLDYIDTRHARMPGVSDSGKDPVIGMVSLRLPIWVRKYRAGVREAKARRLAALRTRADRENLLISRVKMALYARRDAERKMDLYSKTLIPKGRESMKATEGAFRSGKATFFDVLDTVRVLLDFDLAYERALTDHAQRMAELEMLVGRELPRAGAEPDEPDKPEKEDKP